MQLGRRRLFYRHDGVLSILDPWTAQDDSRDDKQLRAGAQLGQGALSALRVMVAVNLHQ